MSTDNEGPLSKLSRLLGLKPIAPIAAVKRISERPVSLNPETFFKMAPTPDLMSDTGVHRLYGDELLRRSPNARAFDLSFDYASYRPEGERWICVDLNTYDGAPDAEAPCNFIGKGASEKEARMDLLEQFADYDERPRPPRGRIVNLGNPETPPEVIDDITFDDDLEDRDER